jgi:hypothetical protein
MMRRLVAWLGHAPGLWLAYREPIPRELRGANVAAVVATLIAIGVVAANVDDGWLRFAVPWLVGHVLWGAYLAWRLPPRDRVGPREPDA